MIVIGVDVHKHSFTAVAVDEVGRMLDERTVPGSMEGLIEWASGLDPERLWAVEDCRQLTRTVERDLLEHDMIAVLLPDVVEVDRAHSDLTDANQGKDLRCTKRSPASIRKARQVIQMT